MPKNLVIVESAGKIKKISEYLGSDYIVKASFGHCMDLDPKNLSVDIENNYKPNYIISEGKHKIIKELKEIVSNCDSVILAADNDREGEAIAWSLANLLNLKDPPRIVFTEITKKALQDAINNPKKINMEIVNAQQTRRILDRLVGYKISPILQKNLNDKEAKSAGRVQSVLVKIINDKEEDINSKTLESYLKSIANLEFEKNKVDCVLSKNFNSSQDAIDFLNLINKNTIFKVIDIQNKLSIRKPSAPFITSTLQQEASTKLKFNVKKTMEIAQKLYEGGYITYMRTDSPNMSQEAINNCKKYILEQYGDKYSNSINYSSSSNAQEAHEAIRPTNINFNSLESNDKDQIKLYNLIWKRTIASQMSPANINIQTITIDSQNMMVNCKTAQNNYQSILNGAKWIATYQTIIFDGFLILYDNNSNDEDSDTSEIKSSIEININDILKFNKIKISEEYNKLPLRYNEANLVKFLEKNNIGRPSTYATLINKILERKYVEIKDINGIQKNSNIIELDKKYKIKESTKEIIVGKESKKIIPTELGIKITKFLQENFDNIMQIDFTSDFESYLDKIAEGKATMYNVLDKFYKTFEPIVDKLNNIKNISNDNLLCVHPITNQEIFIGLGKYGPYIKTIENNKYKFFSIENTNITIDQALELISYPKLLGKIDRKKVELCKGKFGLYIKYDKFNYSIKEDIDEINLEVAKNIIKSKKYKN